MTRRNPGITEPLLTTTEVAALFRVKNKTVTGWVKAGKLSAIRTPGGRDHRYQEREVMALLEAQRTERIVTPSENTTDDVLEG